MALSELRSRLSAPAFATRCGQVSPLIAGVAIVLATTLDAEFSWTHKALSDTGAIDGTLTGAVITFNGGMILAGLVGIPFAWWLVTRSQTRAEAFAAGWCLLAVLGLAGVGLFPLPHPLHAPAAIVHFVAVTLFLLLYGGVYFVHGHRRFGAGTVCLGLGQVLGWVGWGLVLADGPVPGIALPELGSALAFGGWVFAVATIARSRLNHPTDS